MPGDEENHGSGGRIRQGTIVPNEERTAPRRANRISRADPLWARFSAGALAITLAATSAAVPPTDGFLNSTSRINNGEMMSARTLAQAPVERDLSPYLSRVSSNADVAAMMGGSRQNVFLDRLNDLLDALEGARDTPRGPDSRSFNLLSDASLGENWSPRHVQISEMRERYSSLSDEQKGAFIESAAVFLASQLSSGGSARVSDLGPLVYANIGAMLEEAGRFEQATSAAAPTSRSWLESIPIVGSLLRGRRADEVVPQIASGQAMEPIEVELGGGQRVTIDEGRAREILLASGFSESTINRFAGGQLSSDDMVALYYLIDYSTRLNELFSSGNESMPPAIAPSQMQEALELSLNATMVYAFSNFREEFSGRGIDLPAAQMAGIAGVRSVLGGVILGSGIFSMIANHMDPFRPDRVSTYEAAVGAVRAEVNRAIIEPAQAAYDRIKAEHDSLVSRRDAAAGRRAAAQRPQAVAAEHVDIELLDRDIARIRGQVTAAETALTEARGRAQMVFETFRNAVYSGSQLAPDANFGRFGTAVETAFARARAQGAPLGEIPDVLRGIDTRVLDRTLTVPSAQNKIGIRVSGPLGPSAGPHSPIRIEGGTVLREPAIWNPGANAEIAMEYTPARGSEGVWARMFVDPLRMVSGSTGGVRLARAGAVPMRITANIFREAFSGQTKGARAAGIASLLGVLEIAWAMDYHTGLTDIRDPLTALFNWGWSRPAPAAAPRGEQPPQPAVRAEAAPALNEAQRDTQQRLVSVSDAYTSINDADPLLGGRISQFLTRAFGFETRTDYGLEANAQRVSRFDAARAQDAAEFMSMASAAMEGKAGNQAELAFYEAFFKFVTGSDNPRTLFIGNRFLPQAQRLDVYRELFDSTRVGRRGSLSNEAELFEKMRRNSAFISATGPVAQVIDAAVGAGRAQSASAERYLQMWGIAAAIQATDSSQAAVAFARAYLQNYRGVTNLIDGALEGQDRINAYVSVLKKLSASPSMTEDQLEREFLRGQFSRYSNILNAVENYFTDRDAEKQALVYLLGTIRLAASAPGGRPSEVDIENRLMESLTESYPAIRTVMAELAEAFPTGRRAAFSAERTGLLADMALFMRANPDATVGQLSELLISRFKETYPGSEALLETVAPEYQLRFILKLLPYRPRGTVLPATGTGSIAEYASGTEFWGMRTEAWLREHFQGLSPSERASHFVNLPENLQREYWNANSDERNELYGSARGNRTWYSAHGEDLKGRRVGRGRRARTVYPEWR